MSDQQQLRACAKCKVEFTPRMGYEKLCYECYKQGFRVNRTTGAVFQLKEQVDKSAAAVFNKPSTSTINEKLDKIIGLLERIAGRDL